MYIKNGNTVLSEHNLIMLPCVLLLDVGLTEQEEVEECLQRCLFYSNTTV